MTQNSFQLLLTSIASLWISSIYCSTLELTSPSSHKYQLYFHAVYHQQKGDISQAQQQFETLRHTDVSSHMYLGYIPLLFAQQQFADIVKIMPQLNEFLSDQADIQLMFAQALELAGDPEAADQKIIHLQHQFPHDPEITFYAARTHLRKHNHQNAIDTIDQYLHDTVAKPTNFMFYFLKAQIYLAIQDFEHTYENIKRSINLNGRFEQSWLMLGLLHELNGEIEKAVATYQKYLNTVAHSRIIEQQLHKLQNKQRARKFSSKLPHNPKKILHNLTQKTFHETHNYMPGCWQIWRTYSTMPQSTCAI